MWVACWGYHLYSKHISLCTHIFAQNQWDTHKGKCGLCGDPYQGPRRNEYPGGEYATGNIVAHYTSGSTIEVTAQMTSNHKGYHQFSLCEKDNPSRFVQFITFLNVERIRLFEIIQMFLQFCLNLRNDAHYILYDYDKFKFIHMFNRTPYAINRQI